MHVNTIEQVRAHDAASMELAFADSVLHTELVTALKTGASLGVRLAAAKWAIRATKVLSRRLCVGLRCAQDCGGCSEAKREG